MTTLEKINEIVAKYQKMGSKISIEALTAMAIKMVAISEANENSMMAKSNRNSDKKWAKREASENAPTTFKTWGSGCEFDTQHEYQRAMAIKNKMI